MAGELEDIGAKLREERERVNISQRELARRIGLSASLISQIESGQSKPSVSTLYAIVTELDVSVDDVFRSSNGHAEAAHGTSGSNGECGERRRGARRASRRAPRDRSGVRRSLGAAHQPSTRGCRLPARHVRRRRIVGVRLDDGASSGTRVRDRAHRPSRRAARLRTARAGVPAIRSGSIRRNRTACGTWATNRCTASGSWSAATANVAGRSERRRRHGHVRGRDRHARARAPGGAGGLRRGHARRVVQAHPPGAGSTRVSSIGRSSSWRDTSTSRSASRGCSSPARRTDRSAATASAS